MDLPPPQVQTLSYATQPANPWRSVVRIVAWTCVGWGGLHLLAYTVLLVDSGISGISLSTSSWQEWVRMGVDFIGASLLLFGGMQLLLRHGIGSRVVVCGGVVVLLYNLGMPVLEFFLVRSLNGGTYPFLQFVCVYLIDVSWAAHPILLIALTTRRAFREAIVAS